jgi:EmrB/QacA subfamily drug resistance transporter
MSTRQRWTLILASVASLMVGLDMLVVVTALNTIRVHLGGSVADLDWTMNAYTLVIAVLLLTATAAGDRLGRRRVLAAGLAVFIASSAGCALAPSIGVLIAARAIQGAGTAMVLPQAFALVGSAFPAHQRARAMGIFAGITGLATLGGPVVGGAVVQGLAWQWIFWLNVPIGIVLIPLMLRRIEESYGPRAAFDVPGLVLSGGAAFGLVWGLVRGNAAGWGSAQVSGPLVAGVVLMAGFAAWERRARSPMIPVSLFRNSAFVSAMAAGFLMMGAIAGTAFFLAQYLQAGLGQGPLAAGLRLLPWTAVLFPVAPPAGALAGRLGERPVVVAGLVAQAAGFGWMALESGAGYSALIPAMVLAGIGVSAAMPAVQSAAVGAVPSGQIGVGAGTYNVMRMLGNTFGIAIASVVFAANGSFASPSAAGHGFRAALITTAVMSAAGALTGLGLRTRKAAPLPDATRSASEPLVLTDRV